MRSRIFPGGTTAPLSVAIVACAGYWQAVGRAAENDAASLFKQLDANANGELSAEESGHEHALLFRRLLRTGDDDGDGQLVAEEFAAALQPLRAEKPLVEKQGSRLPGADALLVLLAKMDANGDRRLDAQEVPADYRNVFNQMLGPADDDKNGRLDQRELTRAAPRLSLIAARAAALRRIDVPGELAALPQDELAALEQMDAYGRPADRLADPKQAAAAFDRLDANGDGQLTSDEASGPMAERFGNMLRRADANADEQLSRGEFLAMSRRMSEREAMPPGVAADRRGSRQLLNRFDRNRDGVLNSREAPRRLAQQFDRADANADGLLDGAELAAVAKLMGATPRSGAGQPRQAPSPEEDPSTPGEMQMEGEP